MQGILGRMKTHHLPHLELYILSGDNWESEQAPLPRLGFLGYANPDSKIIINKGS